MRRGFYRIGKTRRMHLTQTGPGGRKKKRGRPKGLEGDISPDKRSSIDERGKIEQFSLTQSGNERVKLSARTKHEKNKST